MSKDRGLRLYLGIDAGGTKTSCVVVSEDGSVLGEGTGPAGNFMQLEAAAVTAAIASARTAALLRAGAPGSAVAGACVCLAGFGPDDIPRAHEILDPVLAPARTVYARDLDAALASVCGGGAGLVMVAGTGSVSYGRSESGATHRAGGWGYMVGDEGSAFWLGCQAIRKTLQGFDGRAARASLFQRVREKSGTDAPVALERKVYYERWTPAQYAAYAPLVTASAVDGDPEALSLVDTAAGELASAALAVIKALGLETERCGLAGSLWKAGAVIRTPFERSLRSRAPGIRIVEPAATPAEGAALLALHADGIILGPEQLRRQP